MKEIVETINGLFMATDQRNWELVSKYFDTEVLFDYSSMTGQARAKTSCESIVDSWRSILPGFDQTHHQLGNFMVSELEDRASVTCDGVATHYLQSMQGNLWTVVGSYDFVLQKTQSEWKVVEMTFNFKYQDGNIRLPQLAMHRLKDGIATTADFDNKDTVRQFFCALEEENVDKVASLFAGDGRYTNPYQSDLFPSGAQGREEIRKYWAPVLPGFDEMSFQINEIYEMEDPNIIFVKSLGKMRMKGDAEYYENHYYSIFKFNEEGLISEHLELFNPIMAARGFGLVFKIK